MAVTIKDLLSKLNLDTILKIAIVVTLTASLTINIQFITEHNNYVEISEQRHNDTQKQLKQMQQIENKILREVD